MTMVSTKPQLETPVAFIVFNRPELTERVFKAIAQARPKQLLVIADGPRNAGESEVCAKTREAINVDWECEVLTNYSETNLGCRTRVSSGIDWIFSQVEEAIILEDDCVPSASFFPFCQTMLERYRDDLRIMMITGSNWAEGPLQIDESYLYSEYFNIWGWATWRRAWKRYDVNIDRWSEYREQYQLINLLKEPRIREYYREVWDNLKSIDTWDFQWAFACLFNHGLCVVPKVNLISNIGLFGTHFQGQQQNTDLPAGEIDVDNLVAPRNVFPDARYDAALFAANRAFGAHSLTTPPSESLAAELNYVHDEVKRLREELKTCQAANDELTGTLGLPQYKAVASIGKLFQGSPKFKAFVRSLLGRR